MKVLLINGSPHKKGCTGRALKEVSDMLNKEGIDTETIFIGGNEVRGCIACGICRKKGRCTFDDIVNEVSLKFKECDGIVIGTPVYYAGINGTLKSFLDRLFYSANFDKSFKVGCSVISSRRAGSTSAFDEVNKYFTISNMPIASSSYWNEVHGREEEDVELDLEGLQTMRNLGRNMAFLLKCIDLGKSEFGIPKIERDYITSFCDGLD
jgi:multimeric flavodoxin WrbA